MSNIDHDGFHEVYTKFTKIHENSWNLHENHEKHENHQEIMKLTMLTLKHGFWHWEHQIHGFWHWEHQIHGYWPYGTTVYGYWPYGTTVYGYWDHCTPVHGYWDHCTPVPCTLYPLPRVPPPTARTHYPARSTYLAWSTAVLRSSPGFFWFEHRRGFTTINIRLLSKPVCEMSDLSKPVFDMPVFAWGVSPVLLHFWHFC